MVVAAGPSGPASAGTGGRCLLAAAGLLALLVLGPWGCAPQGERPAAVAGKTAYRGMGIEGARVVAERREGDRWVQADGTRSGYHGSFLLHLQPGSYRLTARAAIPNRGGTRLLTGRVGDLTVAPGARRVDRVVIELR